MTEFDVTPEGWVVADLKAFRIFVGHPPPRAYGYLDQLKEDAQSWKPVAFWVVGIGMPMLALATGWWYLMPLGAAVLALWFWMFWATVRYFRHSPVVIGVIETLKRHPLLHDYSTAQARLTDGREIPVTFPTLLAGDILDEQGAVEVMVLYDPKSEYSMVIAARATSGKS